MRIINSRAMVPVAGIFVSMCLALVVDAQVDEGSVQRAPWSGTYWPIRYGQLISGPLSKYDRITGHLAAAWEQQENPPSMEVPEWFGYCHAWSASSVLDREPTQLRLARAADGAQVPLGIGDQKGMLTACHTDDVAQHYGVRFQGESGDDPNDIYPDELWRVLKLYIQQQGVPLIVDIEGGPQVWNHPVYAYRVDYRREGAGNRYFAEMSLWMADDAVPADIMGIQVSKQTYYFTFQIQWGAPLMGSANWVEPSQSDHPDFAWYPYIVRAENPEIRYDEVKRLVSAATTPSDAHVPNTNIPNTNIPNTNIPNTNIPNTNIPNTNIPNTNIPNTNVPNTNIPGSGAASNIVPGSSGRTPTYAGLPPNQIPNRIPRLPPNVVPGATQIPTAPNQLAPDQLTPNQLAPSHSLPPDPSQPYFLSPMELLQLVIDQTSYFTVDATVDKFDGGHYSIGESFTVGGSVARDGYLYLLYLDSQGQLLFLYPRSGESNFVTANERFSLPVTSQGNPFRTVGPPGTHRIKVIVPTRPLLIGNLPMAGTDGLPPGVQPGVLRLPPTQKAKFKRVLLGYSSGKTKDVDNEFPWSSPHAYLGDFGQDEVAFYVGPAPNDSRGP